jgi:hypothetical protein
MTVNLSFIGGAGWQFFDNNGDPLSGGKVYTYAAGTTTPQTTYTSRSGLIPNANPIVLDAAGRTPEQIWSTEGLLYKYVVANANDAVIRTWDNIGGSEVASDFAQDLANTTNNAKGDALVGFKQSNASGFLPGATARTVNQKLQEFVSVKDFGAIGDGIADDTAAFQSAVNYLQSSASNWVAINTTNGAALQVPTGTYKITSPVNLYSGVHLIGEGIGTQILIASSFSGTAAFNLTSSTISPVYSAAGIHSMAFKQEASSTTVWAISQDKVKSVISINCYFSELWFYVNYCMDMSVYTQQTIYDRVCSAGNVESFIKHVGNTNTFYHVDKEANVGTGTEPIVYISGSGNILQNVLIEGFGAATKTMLFLDGCPTITIDHYHMECNASQYGIHIKDCGNVQFRGSMRLNAPAALMKIENTTAVNAEVLNINSDDNVIYNMIDIDSASTLYIDTLFSRRGLQKKISVPNIKVQESYVFHGVDATGFFTKTTVIDNRLTNQNQFINPSFDSGMYGWNYANFSGTAPTLEEYIDSPFGNKMLHMTFATPTVATITQTFPLSAVDVNIPLTVTAKVKTTAGSIRIYFSGGGYSTDGAIVNSAWITSITNEWVELVATIIPQSTASLQAGIWINNGTDFYLDELSFVKGTQSAPSGTAFRDITLAGNYITYLSAPPSTGRFEKGDIVFNSAPNAGGIVGWVCVTSGTPGTWKTFGNIAP